MTHLLIRVTHLENYSRKHVRNAITHQSVWADIENTRQNTCKTQLRQHPAWKNTKKHMQNCNSVQAINADFQIPRENTCKVQPHALQISQLSEILGTSYKKIRSQRRVHDKTRHKLKSGRQTTDRRQPDNSTNPSRPYTAVCVRACVRACMQASKAKQFPVLGTLASLSPQPCDLICEGIGN